MIHKTARMRRRGMLIGMLSAILLSHCASAQTAPGDAIVTLPPLPQTKRGVITEYMIHVPRTSRLTVHQDNGSVWVSDVTGDMIVVLPDPGPYAIDARTRLCSVTSDLVGKGAKRFLVGTRFSHTGPPSALRVNLRMGRGIFR
jgi:hypothetical protein